MTILNIALCLPELDVVALAQKHSIVAVTERFIVPDKSFVLLPCPQLPDSVQAEPVYQPQIVNSMKAFTQPSEQPLMAAYWAQCVFCQQVVDESAIASVSDSPQERLRHRTIWTHKALLNHLQTRGKLFLSFLKVYALPQAIKIETAPTDEQLYKFLPLPQHLDVFPQNAVLSDAEFAIAKQSFLEPAHLPTENIGSRQDNNKTVPPIPIPPIPTVEDILNSPDWVSKIAEVGNASDGHTFEKLVRKGLISLGFSNTLNKIEASLDPKATGGAGGIDFYANLPYPIVGECKATETNKVQGDPATQLHKLGLKYLTSQEYESSVKLIVAAGKITTHANKIAHGHRMNVIKPETFQLLVALKIKYEEAIELTDFKVYLETAPFGAEADAKIESWIQRWEAEFKQKAQYIQQRSRIIQTIKDLSAQTIHQGQTAFVAIEIRAHYNAKYQPLVTDEAAKDMLKELSSPLSGYLARKQLPGDQERFSFVKDMPLLSG